MVEAELWTEERELERQIAFEEDNLQIKKERLERLKERRTKKYGQGSRFTIKTAWGKEEYLLASMKGDGLGLVSLKTGHHWTCKTLNYNEYSLDEVQEFVGRARILYAAPYSK